MPSISPTHPSDLPFIRQLFETAIAFQQAGGYPVWRGYDEAILKAEMKKRQHFKVLIADKIACIFSLCYVDPMVWRERDQADAIYLHRIIVSTAFKGQRLFGKVLEWAIAHNRDMGRPFVRMDTWANNLKLTAYYQSFGFQIVGYYQTPDSELLPIQQRNNHVVLLEYTI
ncbi:MAG: GNAT family N-acetyltransferase [Bacteroidota bacterium]